MGNKDNRDRAENIDSEDSYYIKLSTLNMGKM